MEKLRYRNLPVSVKLIINVSVTIIFLSALFAAGMAIYAKIYDMSYAAAWGQLITAIKGGK